MDFVAYDGLTATVEGDYSLWDTDKLLGQLERELAGHGGKILTGHTLYSFAHARDAIVVRANSQEIRAKLLIDCMGVGSPVVGAKGVATIKGYYILHGCEVGVRDGVRPVGLDNVVINQRPAFFELFPTSKGTAHTAIILPSRYLKPSRSIKSELLFILRKSHYSGQVIWEPSSKQKSYFGIVPVGRLHTPALDRIVFFGEAGQVNPAASATGLTRMLLVYRQLAESIVQCLKQNRLGRKHLLRAVPEYMSTMNRVFQEILFESLLSFDSDDFRLLVRELNDYPADLVNDLIFAEYEFRSGRTLRLATDALMKPRGVLGRHLLKSISRLFGARRLF
jgi:flavin-dependent dehydrogenase